MYRYNTVGRELAPATIHRTPCDTVGRGLAPAYTFPRGEGGTANAVTDEECGR